MRRAEHASRGLCRVLECPHGLAEIFERRSVVFEERHRVNFVHMEREIMTFSEEASRHRYHFAQQRLGFFEAT